MVMINKFSYVLVLCICAAVCSGQAMAAEYPWQLKRDKDGIKVYTRKVEGSPVLEYKATVTIKAPMADVIALYEDESRFPQWFYQCVEAKLLKDEGPDRKIIYFVLSLPWPVSQRDTVFRRTKLVDAQGAVTYDLTALPDEIPRHKGRVRVPYLKTIWRFTALPDGSTEVYFQQHSDAGGFIPPMIVNKLVVDIPFHSLKNLRKLIFS